MEALRHFWETIAPALGATGILGVFLTLVIFPFIRGKVTKLSTGFDRALEKHDQKVEEIGNAAVDRIKNLSFTQSIQPLAESELQKVTERANAYIEGQVAELKESNEKIVAALSALGAFFDDSIVPEEKKRAFAEAIAAAKTPVIEQVITVEVEEEKPKKSARKNEVIR